MLFTNDIILWNVFMIFIMVIQMKIPPNKRVI